MMKRRIVLVAVLALVAGLLALTSSSSAAPADRAVQAGSCSGSFDTAAFPPTNKCIPCSPSKPCTNPLTVCTYSGNGSHGCCLGYAGVN